MQLRNEDAQHGIRPHILLPLRQAVRIAERSLRQLQADTHKQSLMFAGIISRDDGEPWGPTGMTSTKWTRQPVQTFRICDLYATQPGVLLHALIEATYPVGGDSYPHVIHWRGRYYLEDGHHRVVRAAIDGERTITARVLKVGS